MRRDDGLLTFRCDTRYTGELQMIKEGQEEAERILAAYAANGLSEEARDYFAKWVSSAHMVQISASSCRD